MRTRIFAHITILLSFLIWFLTLPLRVLPIRRRRIVLFAHGGGSSSDYVCNPKYICEGILGSEWADSVELIWLGSNKNSSAHDRRIRWVNVKSLTGIYYLLSSGVIITNGPLFSWFPFRKKQFCLNTWHGGGAYKKLPSDIHRASLIERFKRMMLNRNVDVFLSSSRAFSDRVIRGGMNYSGLIEEVGMPRNDKLIHCDYDNGKIEIIKRRIGVSPNCKILLYAPTFTNQYDNIVDDLDLHDVAQKLVESSGNEWCILTRNHKKDRYYFAADANDAIIFDVSWYPDMQELLLIADLLVTNYSSCMWDYSLLDRPGLIYAPDYDRYSQKPGFYMRDNSWPFLIARNHSDIIELIISGNVWHTSGCQLHYQELGGCETGEATIKTVEMIENALGANRK